MAVRFLERRADASDVLAPARGIVIGLALSAVLWALITMLATHL